MAWRTGPFPTIILLFGAGVVVPLGLALTVESARSDGPSDLTSRGIVYGAPVAVAFGVLGWLAPAGGSVAVASAAIYGTLGLITAAHAIARLSERLRKNSGPLLLRAGPLHELAHDLGLGLFTVAGVWLFASRAGIPLLGFREPVVTFTAAHFHFAGFAAPTIIGGIGRLLSAGGGCSRSVLTLYRVAATAVCAGIPLTAIGIATNATIEKAAAVTLALGMLAASTLIVVVVARRAARDSLASAALFVLSGSTLLLTMALAATFALTSSAGRGSSLAGAIPLPTMIAWHGGANAFGFALPGLLALTLVSRARRAPK